MSAAHAKGIFISGTFTPTPAAAALSKAPHFQNASTPVTVRFSAGTGLPDIPDASPDSLPKGSGWRFHLGPHAHSDIVAHSLNLFPAKNGEEMLGLFTALREGGDAPGNFLATHPAALKFVTAPKQIPESYARLAYFAINAFHFVSAEGTSTTVRYRFVPQAGLAALDDETAKAKGPQYLADEIAARLAPGGAGAAFAFQAQVAEPGDPEDDATVAWPEERRVVDLGEVRLESVLPADAAEQKRIIFDPVPRVEGVEPSADPLLQVRADAYLISGKKRREESGV